MRRSQRLIASGVLLALCSVLAGCGGGGLSSFDPMDMLDFLDTKKKLPGNRQPVFPEGVPGLEQGVPKDLYKGSAEMQSQEQQFKDAGSQQTAAAAAAETAKSAPAPAAEPKARPKKHRHRSTTAPPAADQDAAPAEEAAPPKPAKRAQRAAPAAAPQDQQPAQAAAPAQSGFPAPLPSGSFSR